VDATKAREKSLVGVEKFVEGDEGGAERGLEAQRGVSDRVMTVSGLTGVRGVGDGEGAQLLDR
jgi:hypothetical protein